ncbi:hypothetical protein BH11BAC2_BH11BAC2_17530 [soil metagenome]
MSTKEFFDELKSGRNWLLILVTGALIIPFALYFFKPFLFQSEAVFIVMNNDALGQVLTETSNTQVSTSPEIEVNRLYYLANSTEMLRYLIDHFNLQEHYQTESNSVLDINLSISILKSRIFVKKLDHDAIKVTVNDKNQLLSADIANELVRHLEVINRSFIVEGIRQKIWIYDQVISGIEEESAKSKSELKNLLDTFNHSVNRVYPATGKELSDLKLELAELTDKITHTGENELKFKQIYNKAAAEMDKGNIQSIKLVSEAMPDRRSPLIPLFQVLLAAISTSIVLGIFIIYLIHEYKPYLRKVVS